jgi:hypothetical protein
LLSVPFLSTFAPVKIKDNIFENRRRRASPLKGKKIMISIVLAAVVVAALVAKAVNVNNHIAA